MKLSDATGREWIDDALSKALHEDLNERGDITSLSTIGADQAGEAELVAKGEGIVCGSEWAIRCGELVDPAVKWEFQVEDGDRVQPGLKVATVTGSMRGILISERTALNGLGHLSGIATAAAKAMELVAGTEAVVIDTRKTMPGWRLAEKYAVRCGGGGNHRIGLYDEILIKENHIEAAGGVADAVTAARAWRDAQGDKSIPIEVEVRDLDELNSALQESPDRILLDNFSNEMLREAVKITDGRCVLEASGGITLPVLREVAETGVQRISLGALTHSVIPLDLSLLVRQH